LAPGIYWDWGIKIYLLLWDKNILVIMGPEKLSSCRNRLNGFYQYFKENVIELNKNLFVNGEYTLEASYNAVCKAIRNGFKFSAIFTFNDLMAIGAMKALNDNNFNVPEDVSILGYDNIFIDEIVSPEITTVATPLEELGRFAVKNLIQNSNKKKRTYKKTLLEPKLVIRGSCIKNKQE